MSNRPVVRVLVFWAAILKTAFNFSLFIYFEIRFYVDLAGLELDGLVLQFLLLQLPQYWDCTEAIPLSLTLSWADGVAVPSGVWRCLLLALFTGEVC